MENLRMANEMAEEFSLQLNHNFGVPREKVYQAWVEADRVKQWFGPKGMEVTTAELDVRVGGRYKISFRDTKAGDVHVMGGEYVDISPPERLVFTFKFEGTPEDAPDSLVTVEFLSKGDGTELVLTHERAHSRDARDGYSMGWSSSFDCLVELLAG